MIQRNEIDKSRSIFLVNGFYAFNYIFSYILKFFLVLPKLSKILQKHICRTMSGHTYNHRTNIVSSIKPQFRCGKFIKRHIGVSFLSFLKMQKRVHRAMSYIGFKLGLSSNPVGTLSGNGSLCQLVA